MVCLLFELAGTANATVAYDPTGIGPHQAVGSGYKLPATVDPLVTSAATTELWARVWYPRPFATDSTGAIIPSGLVIMLHGEHPSCGRRVGDWYIDDKADYSATGQCPSGYRVTPNHLGYDYLGERLATWGYVVVSINSNRGVNGTPEDLSENDPRNIKRRGRLILRHLQELAKWNANGGAPASIGFNVKGKLDFSRIALFGHSRGGDGIVAAHLLLKTWRDTEQRLPANTRFRSLVAIGPTDQQTPRITVLGSAHGVLLPMCDADVFELEGMRFYDRAALQGNESAAWPKATFGVWGANHNHYNTEWHTADTYNLATNTEQTHDCPGQGKIFVQRGRSEEQKRTAMYFVMAMVRGTLATPTRPQFLQLIDPSYDLPVPLAATTRFDRGYLAGVRSTMSRRIIVSSHSEADPCGNKSAVTLGVVGHCLTPYEHHSPGTWVTRLRWGPPAGTAQPAYQARFTPPGGALIDLTGMTTLEMRIGPDCANSSATSTACSGRSAQADGIGSQVSRVFFQDVNDVVSSWVSILDHNAEQRPAVALKVGSVHRWHALMSSVRLPLSAFGANFDRTKVKHVWLDLGPANSSGGLNVGDMRLSKTPTAAQPKLPVASAQSGSARIISGNLTRSQPVLSGPRIALAPSAAAPSPAAANASSRTPGAVIRAVRRDVLVVPGDDTSAGIAAQPRREEVVFLDLVTPNDMMESGAGFRVTIGERSFLARNVGRAKAAGGAQLTLMVPAQEIDAAGAGSVLVTSGGSVWNFGPLANASR